MPASSLVLRLGTAFGLQALIALAGPMPLGPVAPRPVALAPGLADPEPAVALRRAA